MPKYLTLKEKADVSKDKKMGIKEGSKKDMKIDAKGTKAQASNQSANVGIKKKPHVNAATKVNNQKITAPVQNFFANKSVMKKKGKGF